MQIPEDLVGPPPSDELDGGIVHLAKKEGHMLPGWRPREWPIAVAEAHSVAVMAVLGTRRQRCRSRTAQRGVSGRAPRDCR
jgi:hypothetical protein